MRCLNGDFADCESPVWAAAVSLACVQNKKSLECAGLPDKPPGAPQGTPGEKRRLRVSHQLKKQAARRFCELCLCVSAWRHGRRDDQQELSLIQQTVHRALARQAFALLQNDLNTLAAFVHHRAAAGGGFF